MLRPDPREEGRAALTLRVFLYIKAAAKVESLSGGAY
jgi:hypothetical protein